MTLPISAQNAGPSQEAMAKARDARERVQLQLQQQAEVTEILACEAKSGPGTQEVPSIADEDEVSRRKDELVQSVDDALKAANLGDLEHQRFTQHLVFHYRRLLHYLGGGAFVQERCNKSATPVAPLRSHPLLGVFELAKAWASEAGATVMHKLKRHDITAAAARATKRRQLD